MNLLPEFELLRPATLDEAVKALAHEGARPLAGGTDLLPNLRRGIGLPARLVDLSALAGLDAIEKTKDGGLRIGALVTIETLAANPLAPPALVQAALGVAGPTHRAQASLGGNLAQDTRCIFYNQSEWWRAGNGYCLKYRGDKCHVVVKSDRCYATYHGDIAPALMALDAKAELVGPKGTRTIALADLYKENGAEHLALAAGEVIAAILVPSQTGWVSAYAKARVRDAIEFPLAGIAVALMRDKAGIGAIRVAITGTNSAPLMIDTADLAGKAWNDAAATTLVAALRKKANVLKSTVTSAKYRRRVLLALARKLVDELWAKAA
ncbi:MAG: 4-hydroxybenzoyl-CoA reductase subunit beta [Rhodospirillales bacterium]|nr:4-hydroxybenzoyl-CoA reductase subunit beta [Rhodospirillales bacterium]